MVSVFLLIGAAAGSARAVSPSSFDPARWALPISEESPVLVAYDGRFYLERNVQDQDGEQMVLSFHQAALSVPVYRSKMHEVIARTVVQVWDLDTPAKLPDTGDRMPGQLYDIRLGGLYRFHFGGMNLAGVSVMVGSPSDRPFTSLEAMSATINGLVSIPTGPRSAWHFTLNWSTNRQFLPYIPLPGAGYRGAIGEYFEFFAGLPILWGKLQPVKWFSVEARYVPIDQISVRAAYRPVRFASIYASFDIDNYRFFRHDRTDDDHRLFYYEKRAALGVRFDVGKTAWVQLAGGYAWDQEFFESDDYDDRDFNNVELSGGPFVSIRAGVRF